MMFLSDFMFALAAVMHGCFLVLEMFFWETPLGLKVFGQSPERAAATALLAKNQGLYNGFLAAGLAWGLAEGHSSLGMRVRLFFGACVVPGLLALEFTTFTRLPARSSSPLSVNGTDSSCGELDAKSRRRSRD